MTDFAALDEPLTAAPRFVIEPPDNHGLPEITRQTALLRDLHMVAPSVLVMAVPNAGLRGPAAIRQAKQEGMKSGAPDLVLMWNRGVAFLEVKSGTGKPSPVQIDLLNVLHDQGHRCAIVRTSAFALALLADWGAPIKVREAA